MFLLQHSTLRLLCGSRYRNGFRGHMKNVIKELILSYLKVENQFQNGMNISIIDFNEAVASRVVLSSSPGRIGANKSEPVK